MDFKRKVVALHGLPGVGKDTMADFLVALRGYTKIAFADPLYEELAAVLGTTVPDLRDRASKTEPQDRFAAFHVGSPEYRAFLLASGVDIMQPQTSRYHLERYGTDYMRALGEPFRWVDRTMSRIVGAETDVVVSDLRAYRDRREIHALKTVCFTSGRPLCVVELLRDVPSPPPHEANNRLPAVSIDAHVTAVEGDPQATFDALLESLDLWFGTD